jgi:hypothetical protein
LTCTISTLLSAGFAALLWYLITQTSADADLWGHLRFGLDLLDTRRLPAWDPYSFTADRFWINHEWLAELWLGIAYTLAGPLGLNLLKIASIALIATIVIAVARSERAATPDIVALTLLVVLATYTRTQVIRPQLFSVAVFAVVLYALHAAERGRHQLLITLPLCFAVWVNLHGAWIVGLACCGCWLAAELWMTRPRRRPLIVALGLAVLAATLINPYGTGMWRFLSETVRPSRPDITDWKPLAQLPAGIIVLDLVLPLIAASAIVLGRQHVRPRHLAIVAILAAGTWRVGRTDAFLQAAVGILLAPQILNGFKAARERLQSPIWLIQIPFGRVVASALVALAFVAGIRQLKTIDLQGAWLPDVTGVEMVRRACSHQNVLTWFDWGEYAIWHLSPNGIRVSMDGRRETVYSTRVLDDHSAFYRNQPGAIDYADRIAADCVWIPSRLDVVAGLQARGWTLVGRTDTSAVLRRKPIGTIIPVVPAAAGPRRFPGP